jgi:regulator of ribosome biosynthesis
MPREKRIPEVKDETKWQKFAKEKGIQKKKKERMVWDEVRQEFAPRWGYKRADAGVEDLAVIEIKNGQDPYADPYAEARKEKTANRSKNLSQQIRNSGGLKGKQKKNKISEFGIGLIYLS